MDPEDTRPSPSQVFTEAYASRELGTVARYTMTVRDGAARYGRLIALEDFLSGAISVRLEFDMGLERGQ